MYTLSNDQLVVSVLDPVADQSRFGTRYCTGGYIFQVADPKLGDLMSGPTYPDSFNWFDGQGIPDAFNLGPLRHQPAFRPDQPAPALPAADQTSLILGVGLCNQAEGKVLEFCTWQVSQSTGSLTMVTQQEFGPYQARLERTVTLTGRTVRSHIQLTNQGRAPISMRWFPHPFYPQPEGDELCKLNIPVTLPAESRYEMGENGFIRRRNWPWTEGHYAALEQMATEKLVILQKHPLLGLVSATCSFVPDFFPIWGNPTTFSWEPFLERTVASGQTLSWWIDYDF